MKNKLLKLSSPGALLGLLMVVMVWAIFAGVSRAETDVASSQEATNGPLAFVNRSPHVIPAAAFAADGFNPDSKFFTFSGGYWRGDSQNYGCMQAPVYLPDGAIIIDMFVSAYDNDTSRGMSVALRRVGNFNGNVNTMATASTSSAGASTSIQVLNDSTILHPEVSYPDYSYYVTTCLTSADLRLYSVRLYYLGYFGYLPLLQR